MELYFNEGIKKDLQSLVDEPFNEAGISKMDGKRGACIVLALIEVREAIQELDATLRELCVVYAKSGVTLEQLITEGLSNFKVVRGILEDIHSREHKEQKEEKEPTLQEVSAESQKKSGVTLSQGQGADSGIS